jgi:hypothetical protein
MIGTRHLCVRVARLRRWLAGAFSSGTFLRLQRATDVPASLANDRVYIIGENGHDWYAALLCPCGCGSILQLNLVAPTRPRWRLRVHEDGAVTLWPSVWRQTGCRCHFWLRHGRVFWVSTSLARQNFG